MDTQKINRLTQILSIAAGSLVYWTIILSSLSNMYFGYVIAAISYAICILFMLTAFNEKALNSGFDVMERFTENPISVCPVCGQVHIKVYTKTFHSKKFNTVYMHATGRVVDTELFSMVFASCEKCGHMWYGGIRFI